MITKEMLYGWLTIKMNGWESAIYKLVNKIRNNEVNKQRKANNLKAVLEVLARSTGDLIVVSIFLSTYYYYGNIPMIQVYVILGFMIGNGYVLCLCMYALLIYVVCYKYIEPMLFFIYYLLLK